ncbi:NAD-dependent epimerase/dehydratase family protein [Variovorax sp. HJSM1_2]|uniref:NAD-dependent epimerase/dehydratase family protein n=1 Tax=Variovorax sp. HJSM1_2 TaxID=3366263 RepID=UPI003BD296FF
MQAPHGRPPAVCVFLSLDGAVFAESEAQVVTRCLITGASGFIGSALTNALQQAPGYQLKLVGRQLKALPQEPHLQAIKIDAINGGTEWAAAVENIDVVVHAAARVHVMQETAQDALAAFRSTNTEGTLRLALQAADAGVHRFVFLSSIGVLGNGGNTVYTEQSDPTPTTPYAVSKCEAEDGLRKIAEHTGMEVVIIRPPLVYGPRAPGNFGRLANLVQRGTPLPLGGVQNLRSLVSIENLVDFIKTCMLHPAAGNQTFLVSDGDDLSTPALVRRMARAMGTNAPLFKLPLPVLHLAASLVGKRSMLQQLTGSLQVDCRKANTRLGWTAPYSVDESLRRTFQKPTTP